MAVLDPLPTAALFSDPGPSSPPTVFPSRPQSTLLTVPLTAAPAASPSPSRSNSRKRSASASPPAASPPHPYVPDPLPDAPPLPPRRTAAAADLLPLFQCPACPPGSTLHHPTTLLCGHTVCASHVTSPTNPPTPPPPSSSHSRPPPNARVHPTCPLPACPGQFPRGGAREYIPTPGTSSQPRVTCYTAPPVDPALRAEVVRVARPRLDTSVESLRGIVERGREDEELARRESEERGRRGMFFPEEEESSEDDDEQPPVGASRPHKRPRTHTILPPPAAPTASAPDDSEPEMTKLEKELLTELVCPMCYLMLYEPVTTPCQHTFCAKCLQRSLDHGPTCPLCREEMPVFSYHIDHPPNKVVLSIMLTAFPEMYHERKVQVEQESKNPRLDTPVFYPLLAFPGSPMMLILFEPRYRLMLRRIMEDQTFRFGAIASSRANSEGMQYGTMLELKSVQMIPDGRAIVHCVGTWRFRTLEKGLLDGYVVARVERVDDYDGDVEREVERAHGQGEEPAALEPSAAVEPTPLFTPPTPSDPFPTTLSAAFVPPASASATPTEPSIQDLMDKCMSFVEQLRSGSAPWVVERLDTTYGEMPATPYEFSFWIAAVLPIDDSEKAKLLPIRSTRLRLRLIVHWIEQLNNNWWFTNGCIIT